MASQQSVSAYEAARLELQTALRSYVPRTDPAGAIKTVGKSFIGDAVRKAAFAYAAAYEPPRFSDALDVRIEGNQISVGVKTQASLDQVAIVDPDDELRRVTYDSLAGAFWEARRNAPEEVRTASLRKARIGANLNGEGPYLGSVIEVAVVIDAAARLEGPGAERVQAFVAEDLAIPGQFDLALELDWNFPAQDVGRVPGD